MPDPPESTLPDELAMIADLSDRSVDHIVDRLSQTESQIETPEGLTASLTGEGEELDSRRVRMLVETLITVWQVALSQDRSPEDWVDQRISALGHAPSQRALTAHQRLRQFVNLPAIRLAARAVDLSMDQPNLLTRTRVLSDLRPVFCDQGLQIEAAVVLHTLQITYRSAGKAGQLAVAMDETDLQRLARQCEKALNKSETMREQICRKAEVPTLSATEMDTER